MRRFQKLIVALLSMLVAAVFAGGLAWADPYEARPHEWRNKNKFKKAVEFHGKTTVKEGADYDVNTDADFNKGLFANNEFVQGIYTHSGVSVLTWDISYGNILLVDLTDLPSLAVALPTITEAMDGYVLTVKNISGATATTLTPTALIDTIEETAGTMTGTADDTVDAAGDSKAFVADYVQSGGTNVWRQLWSNIAQ